MWYEDDSPHLLLIQILNWNIISITGKTSENVSKFIYGRKVGMDKTVGSIYQK